MTSLRVLAGLLASDRYSHKTLADGTGVLLDLESMRVLSLNRTGMFVVDQIAAGVGDVAALERRLVETFEIDAETASSDLRELLDRLERELRTPAAP